MFGDTISDSRQKRRKRQDKGRATPPTHICSPCCNAAGGQAWPSLWQSGLYKPLMLVSRQGIHYLAVEAAAYSLRLWRLTGHGPDFTFDYGPESLVDSYPTNLGDFRCHDYEVVFQMSASAFNIGVRIRNEMSLQELLVRNHLHVLTGSILGHLAVALGATKPKSNTKYLELLSIVLRQMGVSDEDRDRVMAAATKRMEKRSKVKTPEEQAEVG
jgi:hypothetical protein